MVSCLNPWLGRGSLALGLEQTEESADVIISVADGQLRIAEYSFNAGHCIVSMTY